MGVSEDVVMLSVAGIECLIYRPAPSGASHLGGIAASGSVARASASSANSTTNVRTFRAFLTVAGISAEFLLRVFLMDQCVLTANGCCMGEHVLSFCGVDLGNLQ